MSRIASTFAELKAQRRRALIPFIHCGDPDPPDSAALMQALVDGGADIVELGVPFSDPMADGPVIQRAAERALARGVGMTQVFAAVRAFRARNASTPVVLMGYANPVERHDQKRGPGAFVRDAAAAGVDGVLVVDYPPEECADFSTALSRAGLDPIFLLAPTSTDERIKAVAALASGYVYYVSLKGVTGAAHLDTAAVAAMMPRIRAHVRVPVGVGFGIRDAATAAAVAVHADAVVVGSRLVQLLEEAPAEKRMMLARGFMAELRAGMDQASRGGPQ